MIRCSRQTWRGAFYYRMDMWSRGARIRMPVDIRTHGGRRRPLEVRVVGAQCFGFATSLSVIIILNGKCHEDTLWNRRTPTSKLLDCKCVSLQYSRRILLWVCRPNFPSYIHTYYGHLIVVIYIGYLTLLYAVPPQVFISNIILVYGIQWLYNPIYNSTRLRLSDCII